MAEITEFMIRKVAAAYLRSRGIPMEQKTLKNMAYEKRGPPFVYLNPVCAVYRRVDLDTWLDQQLRPT